MRVIVIGIGIIIIIYWLGFLGDFIMLWEKYCVLSLLFVIILFMFYRFSGEILIRNVIYCKNEEKGYYY